MIPAAMSHMQESFFRTISTDGDVMESTSTHPCHRLSIPAARLFWCRHCMQIFEDPITRWRHSKTCLHSAAGKVKKDKNGSTMQFFLSANNLSELCREQNRCRVISRSVGPGHSPGTDLRCFICKMPFVSIEEMRVHVRNPCRRRPTLAVPKHKFSALPAEVKTQIQIPDTASEIIYIKDGHQTVISLGSPYTTEITEPISENQISAVETVVPVASKSEEVAKQSKNRKENKENNVRKRKRILPKEVDDRPNHKTSNSPKSDQQIAFSLPTKPDDAKDVLDDFEAPPIKISKMTNKDPEDETSQATVRANPLQTKEEYSQLLIAEKDNQLFLGGEHLPNGVITEQVTDEAVLLKALSSPVEKFVTGAAAEARLKDLFTTMEMQNKTKLSPSPKQTKTVSPSPKSLGKTGSPTNIRNDDIDKCQNDGLEKDERQLSISQEEEIDTAGLLLYMPPINAGSVTLPDPLLDLQSGLPAEMLLDETTNTNAPIPTAPEVINAFVPSDIMEETKLPSHIFDGDLLPSQIHSEVLFEEIIDEKENPPLVDNQLVEELVSAETNLEEAVKIESSVGINEVEGEMEEFTHFGEVSSVEEVVSTEVPVEESAHIFASIEEFPLPVTVEHVEESPQIFTSIEEIPLPVEEIAHTPIVTPVEEIPVSATVVPIKEIVSPVEEATPVETVPPVMETIPVETLAPVPEATNIEIVPLVKETTHIEAVSPVLEHTPIEAVTPVLERTPVEAVSAVLERTPVEAVSAVLEHTPVETVSAVLDRTPVEAVSAVLEHTPLEAVSPDLEHTPVEALSPVLEPASVEALAPVLKPVPVEAVSAVLERTPVEAVSAVLECTPVEAVSAVLERTPVEAVSAVLERTPVEAVSPILELTPIEAVLPVMENTFIETVPRITDTTPIEIDTAVKEIKLVKVTPYLKAEENQEIPFEESELEQVNNEESALPIAESLEMSNQTAEANPAEKNAEMKTKDEADEEEEASIAEKTEIETKHKSTKLFKCKACSNIFKTSQSLQKHSRVPCKIKHTRSLSQKILRPKQPCLKIEKKPMKKKMVKPMRRPKLMIPIIPITRSELIRPAVPRRPKRFSRRKRKKCFFSDELKRILPFVNVLMSELSDKDRFFYKLGMINQCLKIPSSETTTSTAPNSEAPAVEMLGDSAEQSSLKLQFPGIKTESTYPPEIAPLSPAEVVAAEPQRTSYSASPAVAAACVSDQENPCALAKGLCLSLPTLEKMEDNQFHDPNCISPSHVKPEPPDPPRDPSGVTGQSVQSPCWEAAPDDPNCISPSHVKPEPPDPPREPSGVTGQSVQSPCWEAAPQDPNCISPSHVKPEPPDPPRDSSGVTGQSVQSPCWEAAPHDPNCISPSHVKPEPPDPPREPSGVTGQSVQSPCWKAAPRLAQLPGVTQIVRVTSANPSSADLLNGIDTTNKPSMTHESNQNNILANGKSFSFANSSPHCKTQSKKISKEMVNDSNLDISGHLAAKNLALKWEESEEPLGNVFQNSASQPETISASLQELSIKEESCSDAVQKDSTNLADNKPNKKIRPNSVSKVKIQRTKGRKKAGAKSKKQLRKGKILSPDNTNTSHSSVNKKSTKFKLNLSRAAKHKVIKPINPTKNHNRINERNQKQTDSCTGANIKMRKKKHRSVDSSISNSQKRISSSLSRNVTSLSSKKVTSNRNSAEPASSCKKVASSQISPMATTALCKKEASSESAMATSSSKQCSVSLRKQTPPQQKTQRKEKQELRVVKIEDVSNESGLSNHQNKISSMSTVSTRSSPLAKAICNQGLELLGNQKSTGSMIQKKKKATTSQRQKNKIGKPGNSSIKGKTIQPVSLQIEQRNSSHISNISQQNFKKVIPNGKSHDRNCQVTLSKYHFTDILSSLSEKISTPSEESSPQAETKQRCKGQKQAEPFSEKSSAASLSRVTRRTLQFHNSLADCKDVQKTMVATSKRNNKSLPVSKCSDTHHKNNLKVSQDVSQPIKDCLDHGEHTLFSDKELREKPEVSKNRLQISRTYLAAPTSESKHRKNKVLSRKSATRNQKRLGSPSTDHSNSASIPYLRTRSISKSDLGGIKNDFAPQSKNLISKSLANATYSMSSRAKSKLCSESITNSEFLDKQSVSPTYHDTKSELPTKSNATCLSKSVSKECNKINSNFVRIMESPDISGLKNEKLKEDIKPFPMSGECHSESSVTELLSGESLLNSGSSDPHKTEATAVVTISNTAVTTVSSCSGNNIIVTNSSPVEYQTPFQNSETPFNLSTTATSNPRVSIATQTDSSFLKETKTELSVPFRFL